MKAKRSLTLDMMKGAILGSAVGDALGVPVEFRRRSELAAAPVSEMLGFGTYPVPEGTWSDDTSLSLATLDSLRGGVLDLDDMMSRFAMWLKGGEYTVTGSVFDVGGTTARAIEKYCRGEYKSVTDCGETDSASSGNGSLMRIHPVALYAICFDMKPTDAVNVIKSASSLTHGSKRCHLSCSLYYLLAARLVEEGGTLTEELLSAVIDEARLLLGESEELDEIAEKLYPLPTSEDGVRSSGYVVDSLGAAVWAVATTDSFSAAVLRAVNLGEDTDTVAAIAGSLAGLIYGYSAIPKDWLATLKSTWYIERMCDNAFAAWESPKED